MDNNSIFEMPAKEVRGRRAQHELRAEPRLTPSGAVGTRSLAGLYGLFFVMKAKPLRRSLRAVRCIRQRSNGESRGMMGRPFRRYTRKFLLVVKTWQGSASSAMRTRQASAALIGRSAYLRNRRNTCERRSSIAKSSCTMRRSTRSRIGPESPPSDKTASHVHNGSKRARPLELPCGRILRTGDRFAEVLGPAPCSTRHALSVPRELLHT